MREFEGSRNLFRVNYFIEEDFNDDNSQLYTYEEEKGFLYVDERKCKEPITDSGSLDRYKRYELIEKSGIMEKHYERKWIKKRKERDITEAWHYRHIKGKWFLYYRQFYQIF